MMSERYKKRSKIRYDIMKKTPSNWERVDYDYNYSNAKIKLQELEEKNKGSEYEIKFCRTQMRLIRSEERNEKDYARN